MHTRFLFAIVFIAIVTIALTQTVNAITQSSSGTVTQSQNSQQSNSGAGGVNHCTQKRTVNGVTTITSC